MKGSSLLEQKKHCIICKLKMRQDHLLRTNLKRLKNASIHPLIDDVTWNIHNQKEQEGR